MSDPSREPDTGSRTIVDELTHFVHSETSGGVVLLLATVAGLVWANAAGASYHDLWDHHVTLGAGSLAVDESLGAWVNDALMVVFFFVVGLEIKRELVVGELRDPRAASVPVLAAFGGMVVPALLFLAVNRGADAAVRDAWALPMATDIAFVLGVVALLGRRLPPNLRVFLLTLAIVDDIGGILVIAVFFTSDLSFAWLAGAFALVLVVVALRRLGIGTIAPYVVVGVVLWYCTFRSGIHATVAGVALGLLTPAHPIRGRDVLSTLEHRLHPLSAFVVVPLFALANTGVEISRSLLGDAFGSTVTWGVIVGLVVGKVVGISLATFAGVRVGAGRLPEGVEPRHVVGAGLLAGIGFTVALFIGELAFSDPDLLDRAKIGILVASASAALLGVGWLLLTDRRRGHASVGAD